jgi:iron complex transport system substrate-binding protein
LFLATALLFSVAIPAHAEILVFDDAGQMVELKRPAKRVIALYGAFNEILAAMGHEDLIVARTNADKVPASILSKPSIGTHMRPNIELVLGLKPDLVLQMSGRKEATQAVTALRSFGVTTALFKASSFVELFSVILRVGTLTGSDSAALDLIKSMKQRLARVRATHAAGAARPTVFFEVRYPNLLAAGQESIVTDVILAAGGANAVRNVRKLVRLGEEELLRLDPDVYILQKGPMNRNPIPPAQRSHYRPLKAVRQDRVLVVDEQIFSRPGPRNVDAVERLAAFLRERKQP